MRRERTRGHRRRSGGPAPRSPYGRPIRFFSSLACACRARLCRARQDRSAQRARAISWSRTRQRAATGVRGASEERSPRSGRAPHGPPEGYAEGSTSPTTERPPSATRTRKWTSAPEWGPRRAFISMTGAATQKLGSSLVIRPEVPSTAPTTRPRGPLTTPASVDGPRLPAPRRASGPRREGARAAAPQPHAATREGHGAQRGDGQRHEPLGTDQRDGHAEVAGTREENRQQRDVGPPGELWRGRR